VEYNQNTETTVVNKLPFPMKTKVKILIIAFIHFYCVNHYFDQHLKDEMGRGGCIKMVAM